MSTEMLLRLLLVFMIIVRTFSMERQQPSSPHRTTSPRQSPPPRQTSSPRQSPPPRQTSSFNKKGSGPSILSGGLKFVRGKIKERTYTDAQCVEYCKEQNGFFFNTNMNEYELVSTFGRALAYGVTCSCYVSNNFKQFIINKFNDETVAENFVSWWRRGFRGKNAKSRLNELAEKQGLTAIEFLTSGELGTSKLRRQRSDERKAGLSKQASLTRRLSVLTTELDESRAEVSRLTDQLITKNQEIARIYAEGNAKIVEIDKLQSEMQNKKDLLEKNEQAMAKLQKQFDNINGVYKQKLQEHKNLSEELSTSQQELLRVQDKLKKTEQDLQTSTVEAAELRAEVEKWKAEANKPFFKRMCGPCLGGGATKSPTRKQKGSTTVKK